MGYLTTFTVYNEGLPLIRKYPGRFVDRIQEACLNMGPYSKMIGLGGFSNLVEAKPARHADDCTIYIHMGNCLTEVSRYSQEFQSIIKNNPNFAKDLISFLERELESLKLTSPKD